MKLVTGLVKLSGYAVKIRRTIFAQLKNDIKSGKIATEQVAYRTGRLNELLYKILVETLRLSKNDVVRVSIDYDVVGGDIRFDWSTLNIEIYKYNTELSEKATEEGKRLINEKLADYDFTVTESEKKGPAKYYDIKLGNEKIGTVTAININNDIALSGAVIINGKGYKVTGIVKPSETIESEIKRLVIEAITNNYEISIDEARSIIESSA